MDLLVDQVVSLIKDSGLLPARFDPEMVIGLAEVIVESVQSTQRLHQEPQKPRVHTWDWKGSPDLETVAKIVNEMSGGSVHVTEADTQSDMFAWVFSTEPLTPEEATTAFEEDWVSHDD